MMYPFCATQNQNGVKETGFVLYHNNHLIHCFHLLQEFFFLILNINYKTGDYVTERFVYSSKCYDGSPPEWKVDNSTCKYDRLQLCLIQ